MRDEFSSSVKRVLAQRVAYHCSNPDCGQVTSGPQSDPAKSVNIGVAAHICAAAPGGPRFAESQDAETRAGIENGVWLCQNCAKLVDSDVDRYTAEILLQWKANAEKSALVVLERGLQEGGATGALLAGKLLRLMPELLSEMKEDLCAHPLKREFVLLKRTWCYNARGVELAYFFEDHPDLLDRIRLLENYGLVIDITYNNTDRFRFTEDFVDCLTGVGEASDHDGCGE